MRSERTEAHQNSRAIQIMKLVGLFVPNQCAFETDRMFASGISLVCMNMNYDAPIGKNYSI